MKYSNCLIEAIKAKIRNPKNVKIHFIRPCLNNGFIHFYWIEDDSVCQYGHKQPIKIPILFEGKVRRHCRTSFEERLYKKMEALGWSVEKQKEYASKKDFKHREPFRIEWDYSEY